MAVFRKAAAFPDKRIPGDLISLNLSQAFDVKAQEKLLIKLVRMGINGERNLGKLGNARRGGGNGWS